MKKRIVTGFVLTFFLNAIHSQLNVPKNTFTKADTLRGSLNENRNWWDVLRYDITVRPDFNTKTIEGKTDLHFLANRTSNQLMQIDLQSPLVIDSIIMNKQLLEFKKEDINSWLVTMPKSTKPAGRKQQKGNSAQTFISIYYHGKPREAIRAPWDGGWIWSKDENGRPWMSVACQGLGASVWYPCKDHQSDEPDKGASLTMIVPDSLTAIANGKLINVSTLPNTSLKSYKWSVQNPINNYNVIPYIGKYVNYTDTLKGEKGNLDLSYWVLDYNLTKATTHFTQVKQMLRAFEYWMGPYPFYEDGYKLIESPHLGMEHQSAIAYGNKFQNGYLGRDLSGSGWGKKWDFIIIHESGHEWYANNITTKDIADMWVHEGFTNYSETLFTEYYYGKQAGNEYNFGIRKNISNDSPIIGFYGVNKEGSGDMYYKGSNLIHTIRSSMNNDEQFRQMLREMNKTFYHQTVTTKQIEDFMSKFAKFEYAKVFDQYLRTIQIPQLTLTKSKSDSSLFELNWSDCINGFNLPITIPVSNKRLLITENVKSFNLSKEEAAWLNKKEIEALYYINVKAN